MPTPAWCGALAGVDDGQLGAVGAAQPAAVARLATALRVEDAAVQLDAGLGHGGEGGLAVQQRGVAAEEFFSHAADDALAGSGLGLKEGFGL